MWDWQKASKTVEERGLVQRQKQWKCLGGGANSQEAAKILGRLGITSERVMKFVLGNSGRGREVRGFMKIDKIDAEKCFIIS